MHWSFPRQHSNLQKLTWRHLWDQWQTKLKQERAIKCLRVYVRQLQDLQKIKKAVVDLMLFLDICGIHKSVVQNWNGNIFGTNGIKLDTRQHQTIYNIYMFIVLQTDQITGCIVHKSCFTLQLAQHRSLEHFLLIKLALESINTLQGVYRFNWTNFQVWYSRV